MVPLALLSVCLALLFPGRGLAAEGQCSYYKWGGLLRMKYYVCCNNCGENNGEPNCGQTTYLAGSKGDYCGSCGEDRGDAKETVSTFGCGGCEGQAHVKAGCDHRYVYAGASFCWLHSKCFELRCLQVAQTALPGSSPTEEPYCGDSHCDTHLEDASSCPFDCCPLRNPEECRHPHHCSKCPPLCCAEPGCCLD